MVHCFWQKWKPSGQFESFYVFEMNSCEEHPLRQTNDLRQFPKGMIIYKHLLAVMMIQSRTIVNAFMSSAKLLTSAECKPVFFLSVIVLKTLQELSCIIWWASLHVLDHIVQKDKTSDWWTTRTGVSSKPLPGWNCLETEMCPNSITIRSVKGLF